MGGEATLRVKFRYISGVTNDSRIIFGNRIIEIIHVNNSSENNADLELMCLEPE